jgi:hypothetical protein
MSPEAHRAALARALASGDWAMAERATRARAWRHLAGTFMRLARRLWPAWRP